MTRRTTVVRASILALILPYVEQANKYNQCDFDYDVNSDAAIHSSVPALVSGPDSAARIQDIPIYLCPSDGSGKQLLQRRRPEQLPRLPGCVCRRAKLLAGWGASSPCPSRRAGQEMRGYTIVSIADGPSNTAPYSEEMRSDEELNDDHRDNTTVINDASGGWTPTA